MRSGEVSLRKESCLLGGRVGFSQMKKGEVEGKTFQGDSGIKKTVLHVITWKACRCRAACLPERGEPGLSRVRRCPRHFVER